MKSNIIRFRMEKNNIKELVNHYALKRKEWADYKNLIRKKIKQGEITFSTLEDLISDKKPKFLDPRILKSINYMSWIYQFLNEKNPIAETMGRYYTSDWLCEFMYDMSKPNISTSDSQLHILDPSCGSGNLINYAIMNINCNLVIDGLDIDEKALEICKISAENTSVLRNFYNTLKINIQKKDFIRENNFGKYYDFCILTPPYINIKKLNSIYKKSLLNYNDNITNTSEYFIMKSFDHLKEGGTISFICPSKLITKHSYLYSYLQKNAQPIVMTKIYGGETTEVVVANFIKSKKARYESMLFEIK